MHSSHDQSSTGRPAAGTHLGIFLTAMSVLLLEVALTRVFAILMWHHFAYMVVSLALLGFGASGSLLTAFPGAGGTSDARAGRVATGYGVAVVLAFLAVTRIRIDSLEIWNAPANFALLFLTFAVLSVPFLLAGLAIGSTFNRHPKDIGRLYFVDLLGSAGGGAMAPWLLDRVGSTTTVMVAATIGLLGGAAFAGRRALRPVAALPVLGGVALVIAFSGGGLGIPALHWEIPFAPHKGAAALFEGARHDRTLHSSTAQVDVATPMPGEVTIGGQFGDRDYQGFVEMRPVTQDGTAPTALHKDAANLARYPCLDDSQAGSAYVAWKARGRAPQDVLVIGCGGGIDVMVALAANAGRVTAVDINAAMIRMVTTEYGDYLGRLFDDPRVELVHGEGRAYIRHSARKYDVIQLSGVDTFTALATGAYTLSESYLYTVEAVKDLYTHLSDDGIVTWSRFMLTWPRLPRESIRLAHIARVALDELGVPEPWRHIVVLQAHHAASTMIKRTPFTEAEVQALREFCAVENFMGLVLDPFRPRGGPYEPGRTSDADIRHRVDAVVLAASRGLPPGALDGGPIVTTFREHFGKALRAAVSGDLEGSDREIATLPQALGLPAAAAPPLVASLAKDRDDFVVLRRRKSEGFAFAQQSFETLVRGSDAERDAFVRDYHFNLEPSTDDQPFFFDYFRLGKFLEYAKSREAWSAEYHPEFPVGHMVLLSSLLQIALLAAVLILLPLRRLRKTGQPAPRRFATFMYFAALGLGFMFVEIALMQKFILFLGHPTYSLSVVLCGMLAFSGLGASLSSRIRSLTPSTFRRILAVLLVLVALEALAAYRLLPALLGLPMAARVAIALSLLAPLALVMGMPFPLGIRLLEAHAKPLIPWGWAVNGFLSVFSSLSATLLAMQVGFTPVLAAAALIYTVGLLLAPCPKGVPGTS